MELTFAAAPFLSPRRQRDQVLHVRASRGIPITRHVALSHRTQIVGVLRNARFEQNNEHSQWKVSMAHKQTAKRKKASFFGIALLIISYAWSVLLFIPMVIGHPFVLAFDRHRRRFHDFISLLWMKCSLVSSMVRPRVINRYNLPKPGEPVIYVANHASYLDIFAVSFLGRSLKFVSKSEIFRLPIVGWAMSMTGNIGVKRMNRRGQMEAYRRMVEALRRGVSLVVYPEGTRSESGNMREFQSGAFRAAKAAGVRVVPITINGTREIMPSYAYVPLHAPKAPIKLVVHPPIDARKHSLEELKDLSFAAISSALTVSP